MAYALGLSVLTEILNLMVGNGTKLVCVTHGELSAIGWQWQ
jgi:hypothetical protein